MPHIPWKRFQLRQSKICKKLKNALFKRPQYSLLSSRKLQNLFSKKLPMTKIWCFASLSQKMVLTSSLKKLQRTEKCYFQRPRAFAFDIKVASKSFSKRLTKTKFWFKQFLTFCVTFPENGLNFVIKKFRKNWKMPFSKAQKIGFWAQASFKAIFKKVYYDQLWIQMVLKALLRFLRKQF